MSRRETIAIDIDDVLADNASRFTEFSNQSWGTNLTPDQYSEHWTKLWNVDNQETARRANVIYESGIFRTYSPDENALPVLGRLSQDFRLLVITARQLRTKDDTVSWIHQHYPEVFTNEAIHFAGIWDKVEDQSAELTKASIADSLDVDYLIDDQLKHCLAVGELGKRALLFGDYGWNQTEELPDGVIRVADWREVDGYFYGD